MCVWERAKSFISCKTSKVIQGICALLILTHTCCHCLKGLQNSKKVCNQLTVVYLKTTWTSGVFGSEGNQRAASWNLCRYAVCGFLCVTNLEIFQGSIFSPSYEHFQACASEINLTPNSCTNLNLRTEGESMPKIGSRSGTQFCSLNFSLLRTF